MLSQITESYIAHRELILNTSRILSKLSVHPEALELMNAFGS